MLSIMPSFSFFLKKRIFFLKCWACDRLSDGKQVLSVNPLDYSPLTACLSLADSNLLILGTMQNEVALYQVDCCRLDSVAQVHDDNITALGKCESA